MSSFFAQSIMPIINWALIAPEVIICIAAVVVMLVDAFARPTQRWLTGTISLVGIVSRRSRYHLSLDKWNSGCRCVQRNDRAG